MATILTLASGSSGNCTLVSDNGRHILIDMGISLKATQAALKQERLCMDDISAIVITHAHSDHIKGLQTTSKRHGVPIYATEATARQVCGQYYEAEPYINIICEDSYFMAGGFDICSFETPHDCEGSVGFRVECGFGALGFMTDLGYVAPSILSALRGVSVTILEANHDVDMLKTGPYPYFLKSRILSRYGHLSNEDSAEAARELAEAGCRRFVLAHLSRENNTPVIAHSTVFNTLRGCDAELTVAPQGVGEVISL